MTIGLNTTLLREAFYLKKKVFACNLTQHENADFPIRNIASPRIKNFNEFEIHTLKLLEMRTEQYFEILKDQVDKVVKFGVKPDKIILDNISKIINS
jgi:acetoin utilization deacetylase AcuC-like enzyme